VSRAYLVTGTDTGIGKTLVGCALAAALSKRLRVGVLKPAETGCPERSGELFPDDAHRLREAAGCELPLEIICPFRYAEPLAPWLAAERAGRPIALEHLRDCFATLAAASDVVLVESAGGLLVPLTADYSFADLAADLRLALVIVVGSRLGALNQTLLTIEVARRRGLDVAGYVLNQLGRERDLAQSSNPAALVRLTDVACLGELPFIDAADTLSRARLRELGAPIASRLGS